MAVPQTAEKRIQWLREHKGRRLQSRVEELLDEFQRALSNAKSGCQLKDILVGGSFVDNRTDNPSDIDIAVITDKPPSSSVRDGFWRYINDQTVINTSIDVDCVWVLEKQEIPDQWLDSTQYSVQAAEVVDIHEYTDRGSQEIIS